MVRVVGVRGEGVRLINELIEATDRPPDKQSARGPHAVAAAVVVAAKIKAADACAAPQGSDDRIFRYSECIQWNHFYVIFTGKILPQRENSEAALFMGEPFDSPAQLHSKSAAAALRATHYID